MHICQLMQGLLNYPVLIRNQLNTTPSNGTLNIVVVYYVTIIVALGHGLLKKFWLMIIGCVQRTAGSSLD